MKKAKSGSMEEFGDKVGAYIFNQKSGTLKHLTASNGLNGDNVFGIYKDKMDNIWLYCSGGITVYDPRSKTFKYLTAAGGLSDDGFGVAWKMTREICGFCLLDMAWMSLILKKKP